MGNILYKFIHSVTADIHCHLKVGDVNPFFRCTKHSGVVQGVEGQSTLGNPDRTEGRGKKVIITASP